MSQGRALLCVLLLAVALNAASAVTLDSRAGALVDSCRQDLAKRLQVAPTQVTLEEMKPVTWQSYALGLPEPGKFEATALIGGGIKLTLHAPQGMYLYHARLDRVAEFKYAGPRDLWNASALYMEPAANDPNLNGNLVQVSLLGTNSFTLATGISDSFPQTNGPILATRRTSKSGFDLLLLMNEQTLYLGSAFDFASPILAGAPIATFFRPRVGAPWQVELITLSAPTPGPATAMVPAAEVLPDLPVAGEPVRLVWRPDNQLEAILHVGQGLQSFKLVGDNGVKRWETVAVPPETPGKFSLMLSPSYSLIVENSTTGKPSARIYEESSQGTQRPIATLDNFTMNQVEVTPDQRFALIVGQRGDVRQAYTVDLNTGETFLTLPAATGPMHLYSLGAHQEATVPCK